MARWGIAIDLRKCDGCGCCAVNCSQVNHLPPDVAWRQIVNVELRVGATSRRVHLPLSCMHCANAPCESVCPTAATYHRSDGIVDIDAQRCIGCGSCVVACPYMARTLLDIAESRKLAASGVEVPGFGIALRQDLDGTCTKCNLCLPRLDAGLAQGLTPGVDADATPVCVNTCISNAIHFGDLDDPESAVSRVIRENRVSRVNEHLGTEPSIYYVVE